MTIVGTVWIAPIFDHSDEDLKHDLTVLLANPPGTKASEVAISAASNPLPNAGFPHGRGISREDFPDGYRFQGEPRPTFDSYVEGPASEFADERHFLRACFLNDEKAGCLTRTTQAHSGPLAVAPGDELLISALVDNNGDPNGNQGGQGPAVARNCRILFAFPTRQRKPILHLSSYLYADNTVVDESRPALKTISDNFGFSSTTGKPITLRYRPHSAYVLQARHKQDEDDAEPGEYVYQQWILTGDQQRMMFTGNRSRVEGNTETDPALGLPIGSTGSFEPDAAVGRRSEAERACFAGEAYHLFVQFKVRVNGEW